MNPVLPRLLAALLLLLAFAGCATSRSKLAPTAEAPAGKRMTVRTTAYTHTEAGGSKNAIGTALRFGRGKEYSAASDWSWMPLGTRFRIVGKEPIYIIEDYGSALVGRQTVDLYMPTRAQMRAWGVRHVPIEIIEWGSKTMSLKLLAPRSRNAHVARMCAQLRKQGVKPAPPLSRAKSPGKRRR